jgi:hypothetical protein
MSVRRLTSGAVRTRRLHASMVWAALTALTAVALAAPLTSSALAASEACPNAAYRTGFASRLPDCRAYEMVTPPYKEGFAAFIDAGSLDSSVLLGESAGVFSGMQNDLGLGGHYTFSRGPSGWVPAALEPPARLYPTSKFAAMSADGATTLWIASNQSQDAGNQSLHFATPPGDFLIRRSDGSLVNVGSRYPQGATAEDIDQAGESGAIAGASADLSSVFFTGRKLHWPGDPTLQGADSLYEYVGTGNSAPSLVGVNGGLDSTSVISECGTELGPSAPARESTRRVGAISTSSGASVFFTALACGASPPVNELFARVGGGRTDVHTVAISEPVKGDCEQCNTASGVLQNAEFQGASADGSKVFFTTKQPLLGNDVTTNLYEYDFNSPPGERIVRVSGGDSTVSEPTADVAEVLRVSSDGSFVYFVAHGILTNSPNGQGQIAEANKPNLYVFERDGKYPSGHIAFITSGSLFTEKVATSGVATSNSISPDGRFFAFLSADRLTLDDTSILPQGFEYDSETGNLVRFTVGQGGYDNNGNTADFSTILGGATGRESTPTGTTGDLGPVANDGVVFFLSTAPLTEQAALNNTSVYEYSAGNIYLISASPSTSPAELIGADASGTNVFFVTRDQLLPQDGDTQEDVYDARIDGGFPSPISPPSCEGDGCQGGLSGAPVLLSPGSEFQVGGNPPLASSPKAVKPTPKAKSKKKPAKSKKKPKEKRKNRGRKAARTGRTSGRVNKGRK